MAGPANQDPRIASAPDSEALSQAIVDFDAEIAALRARFDQYFLGLDKNNPGKDLEALKKRLLKFKTQPIRNTGIKFRVQTLYNKFQSYERLWTKSLKEIEEGTYRRDLLRLKRKNQARGTVDPTAAKAKGPESEEQKPRPDFYTLDEDLEADLPIDIFEDDDVPAPVAKPPPAPVAAARPPAAPPAAAAAARPPAPPAAATVPGARPAPAPAALSSTSKVGPAPTAPARGGPGPTALSSTSKVGSAPTAPASPASTARVGPAPGAPPRVGPPPAPGAPPVVRPAAPTTAARPPPPPAGAAAARPVAASSPPLAPRTATGSIPIPVAPGARPPPPPAAARAAAGPSADVPLSKEKLDQIYSAYITAKKRCKESTDGITPDALAQSLRKQVPALIEQHGAKSVDFKVVIKDGKAVLKAVPKG